MATRLREVQYHVLVYAQDGNGGPSTLKLDLTPDVLNLTWQKAVNLAGMCAFTLARGNPKLDSILWMQDHVKVWRSDDLGAPPLFSGKLVKPQYEATDVVCMAWDYKAFLQLSRTGYNVEYPQKLLGSEIVAPEWALAKNAVSSPLAFVTTGTIEDPLALDGVTAIKTNDDFGVSMFNRLFTFFQLAEMGMANTSNTVVFDISDTLPHTFSFRKNVGSLSSLLLSWPGNLSSFQFQPGYDLIRNDRATVITGTDGAEEVYTVDDPTSIGSYRRLQDAQTPRTLMGLSASAVEADQLKEFMARALKEGIRLPKVLSLNPRQGLVSPGVNLSLADTVRVRLRNESNGTLLATTVRVIQMAGAWSGYGGEALQIQVRGAD